MFQTPSMANWVPEPVHVPAEARRRSSDDPTFGLPGNENCSSTLLASTGLPESYSVTRASYVFVPDRAG